MANQITENPNVPSQIVVHGTKFPTFMHGLGIIPTSYKDSMDYYECLVWLCKYLEETILPTLNQNGEAVQELQNLFVELNQYVDNYFKTLDVQEEINNKLDEMTESGTLQEIIASYLNSKAIFGFDNVEDMKNATNLINGSYAKTLGYNSKNDGGSALYKIRNRTFDDVVDNATIILLSETIVAELIIENEVNPQQFGCVGDGVTDDTTNFQKALDFAGLNHKTLILPKLYLVDRLKLKSSDNNYIYNIKGNTQLQKGATTPPLKNGLITHTHCFTTDELDNTIIQAHFDGVSASSIDKTTEYSSFIERIHLERSSVSNCSITGFDYILHGSCNVKTMFRNSHFKNIKKAFFKVYPNFTHGFYDSTIDNNYINAFHDSTFRGSPSLRTSVILAPETYGLGIDSSFTNNFVDYFTYFIDAGKTFDIENQSLPSFVTRECGQVFHNVFQDMLNMIGVGINLYGIFTNNDFMAFTKDMYLYLDKEHSGPFSLATYTIELDDNGDDTETFPYRKFEHLTLTNNNFENCNTGVYFDFDYNSVPGITASTYRANNCIIMNNQSRSSQTFEEISKFAPQYSDQIFKYTKCQMWDNIQMSDVAMTDYKVIHDSKLHAHQGSIAQFSDGMFIAYYDHSRYYIWKKISIT